QSSANPKRLNLLTATFIVSGSMIGSGIFIVSADMGRVLGSPFLLLLAWVITGVMTLIAALSYGELAGMFPKSGGQYQYLKESYGEMIAFLYGWAMFAVIQCGTIAAVAVAFAKFTGVLVPALGPDNVLADLGFVKISAAQLLAIVSLLILTWLNTRGLQTGAIIQNILTAAKALSLGLLIVLGIFIFKNPEVVSMNFGHFFENMRSTESLGFLAISSAIGVAMVGSLFSSDAWNNVTFIAGEIENPKRNVPLALAFGVLGVTVLYLLANIAYLCVLPFWGDPAGADVLSKGIQQATQDRVGTAALTAMLGAGGAVLMAVMIMISTFGCNNGLVLAGARVYHSMANDGLFFDKMKNLNPQGVPAFALWVQFIWCAVLCLSGKYGDLLDYVMFAVMLFYILTVAGIFILRKKRPELERPYKAFGYPYLPALYILLAVLFTLNLLFTKPQFTVPGLVIVGVGIPLYYWAKGRRNMA
ncbi:MAG: amino acid permease, partial [Saprospiraceae bacterium]|nr:amino acid permease [Saprospiraceae bacterium]